MSIVPRDALLDIIGDGRWHKLTEFFPLARKYVTPERACREVWRSRGGKKPDMALDQQISRGRRRFIEEMLRKMSYSKHFRVERRGQGMAKQYRKVPHASKH
jgi:hypothetical protein